MGLYTGVRAIKKVEGFDNNLVIKARYYDNYKNDTVNYIKCGGYPKLHIMLDVLGKHEYIADTQENYDKLHKEYTALMTPLVELIETVEDNKQLQDISYLELCFFKNDYDLANYLQGKLKQSNLYFRQSVEPTLIMEIFYEYYEQVKDLGSKYRFFSKELLVRLENDLNKYKDTHFFEVFVS